MPISHANTSYLLVLQWDGTEKLATIKERFKSCFADKEHAEILVFTQLKRPKTDFEVPSRMYVISRSDFSLFGKIKSKKFLPTTYTHFDVIMILDELSTKQDQIVKQLKIKHVVAFDYERDYVEINLIQSNQKPTEKVNFAKQILTKISD